jgi:hypothetical protein
MANSNGIHRTKRTRQPLPDNHQSEPYDRRRHEEQTVDAYDFERVTDGLSAISGVMQSDAPAKVKIGRLCLILSVLDDEGYID